MQLLKSIGVCDVPANGKMSGCQTTDLDALTPKSWAGFARKQKMTLKSENDIVMKEQTTNRARRFTCRFTPDEYTKIEAKWKASTCRKLSDYVRHCLFNKPITTMIRNQSIDDLMTELSDLRTELNRIGNNFNQAVKRLHTLQSSDEFKQWQIVYESDKNALLQQVLDIKTQMQKIAEEWLQ